MQSGKSLSVFYFVAGLLVGTFLGSSIGRQWSNVVAKSISAGTIVILAFFWRRIEALAHDYYLESWPDRQNKGERRFILVHYILIRGLVFALAAGGPVFPSLPLTHHTLLTIFAFALAIVLLMMFLGHQAWVQCREDYRIRLLRHAADLSRAVTN